MLVILSFFPHPPSYLTARIVFGLCWWVHMCVRLHLPWLGTCQVEGDLGTGFGVFLPPSQGIVSSYSIALDLLVSVDKPGCQQPG